MHFSNLVLLATGLAAMPALAAPAVAVEEMAITKDIPGNMPTVAAPAPDIEVRDVAKYKPGLHWFIDLGDNYYRRCIWRIADKGMRLIQCGNMKKVPSGVPVTGPYAGDYNPAATVDFVRKPHFANNKPDNTRFQQAYELAILKGGETGWRNCSTSAQGAFWFGGHSSYCPDPIGWDEIPAGAMILGIGKKRNTTDEPHLPYQLGQWVINGGPGGMAADEDEDHVPTKRSVEADADLSTPDSDLAEFNGTSYGRFKHINGSSYLLTFSHQHKYKETTWTEIPMGAYVYNVGFKSTDDEPEAENPWVDHCTHVSCLRCEEDECKDQFRVTIPATRHEELCVERDEDGMCATWKVRSHDPEGHARLCQMGMPGFCWDE